MATKYPRDPPTPYRYLFVDGPRHEDNVKGLLQRGRQLTINSFGYIDSNTGATGITQSEYSGSFQVRIPRIDDLVVNSGPESVDPLYGKGYQWYDASDVIVQFPQGSDLIIRPYSESSSMSARVASTPTKSMIGRSNSSDVPIHALAAGQRRQAKSIGNTTSTTNTRYRCTPCTAGFTSKRDWRRHEGDLHVPRVDQTGQSCGPLGGSVRHMVSSYSKADLVIPFLDEETPNSYENLRQQTGPRIGFMVTHDVYADQPASLRTAFTAVTSISTSLDIFQVPIASLKIVPRHDGSAAGKGELVRVASRVHASEHKENVVEGPLPLNTAIKSQLQDSLAMESKECRCRESHNVVEHCRRDNINKCIQNLSRPVSEHQMVDENIQERLRTHDSPTHEDSNNASIAYEPKKIGLRAIPSPSQDGSLHKHSFLEASSSTAGIYPSKFSYARLELFSSACKDGGVRTGQEVGAFDAQFFGRSSEEDSFMDPQQRLFLQTCYEALEFTANSADEVKNVKKRVSIRLPGPLVLLNTACASNITARHHAIRSLIPKPSQGEVSCYASHWSGAKRLWTTADILMERDRLFLVDNSKSEQNYWAKIKHVSILLADAVKRIDSDGISMMFQKSTAHVFSNGQDMIERLGRTLDQYLAGRQERKYIVDVIILGEWSSPTFASLARLMEEFSHSKRRRTDQDNIRVRFAAVTAKHSTFHTFRELCQQYTFTSIVRPGAILDSWDGIIHFREAIKLDEMRRVFCGTKLGESSMSQNINPCNTLEDTRPMHYMGKNHRDESEKKRTELENLFMINQKRFCGGSTFASDGHDRKRRRIV
ncbi:hypothetical protein N0V90_008592 [Kalmusia sp. IMI 367209]|nr:hypothetical protein N0V90_008592 [Kalmusia sp. IMI 367209]